MAGQGGTEHTVGALLGLLPRHPPLVNWLCAGMELGTRLLCSEGSRGAGRLVHAEHQGRDEGSPSGSSHVLHSPPRGSCFLWFYFPVLILER